MTPETVDFSALAFLVFRALVVVFGFYVFILLVIRMSNFYRITVCPSCGGALKRSQRKRPDKLLAILSFGILRVKRFRCYSCYWEGQAFGKRTRKKS